MANPERCEKFAEAGKLSPHFKIKSVLWDSERFIIKSEQKKGVLTNGRL